MTAVGGGGLGGEVLELFELWTLKFRVEKKRAPHHVDVSFCDVTKRDVYKSVIFRKEAGGAGRKKRRREGSRYSRFLSRLCYQMGYSQLLLLVVLCSILCYNIY
jgi:hypothetical protein